MESTAGVLHPRARVRDLPKQARDQEAPQAQDEPEEDDEAHQGLPQPRHARGAPG